MKILTRYKKQIIILSILVLIIGFSFRFIREYEIVGSYPISSWTIDQRADCAVVLTGGAHRVREGFDLLAQGQVYKLIVSGVHSGAQFKDLLPMRLAYGKLNEQDVFLERQSQTTFGNAVQSLQIVEVLRCRDVLLVTSNLHMYRSLRTFRAMYPSEIALIPHAVPSGTSPVTQSEIFFESLKSLFYSLWAYSSTL